jgi:hypothetical protein
MIGNVIAPNSALETLPRKILFIVPFPVLPITIKSIRFCL